MQKLPNIHFSEVQKCEKDKNNTDQIFERIENPGFQLTFQLTIEKKKIKKNIDLWA